MYDLYKHAKLITDYSLGIRGGESVLIRGELISSPLIEACYRYLIEVGAFPYIEFNNPKIDEILLSYGSDEQIEKTYLFESEKIATFDCGITIKGSENTDQLSLVDPQKIKRYTQARKGFGEIISNRKSTGEYRWAGTQYPAIGEANDANLSVDEYKNFVAKAVKLDCDDPVREWRKVKEEQQAATDYLNQVKRVRFLSSTTDLTLSVENRNWINSCGKANLPDGEIFTAPVESSANGFIGFTFPGIYWGKEVENIKLHFNNGVVTSFSADKGYDILEKTLKIDEGSSRIGEIAIGTNFSIDKFTRNMLFDEKIGGTIHLALGNSIPGTKGLNRSSIHWDMLADMRADGEIYGDGKLIYSRGRFLI